MRATLIVSLVTAVLTLIFALSNTQPMDVNLLVTSVRSSTAAVLIVTFILGIVVGTLATLPSRLRKHKERKDLKRHTSPSDSSKSTPGVRPSSTTPPPSSASSGRSSLGNSSSGKSSSGTSSSS